MALFHHFFLQFLHIVGIGQKAYNTSTSRPPVRSILQILRTFNLYSGRPKMGLSVNNKQNVRQAMVKISKGGWQPSPPPPPPPLARYVSRNGLTIGGIIRIHSELFSYFFRFNASALLSFLKAAVQVLLPHLCNFAK